MKLPRLLVYLVIAVGAVALSLLAQQPWTGPLEDTVTSVEERSLDLRQRIARDRAYEEGIALVLFDSASIREWPYLSPYPRAVLAEIIRTVSAAGPRAIGLDVYLDRLYPELNRLDRGDERLREAIAAAGNVILVAPTVVDEAGPRLAVPHPYFAEVAAGVGSAELPNAFDNVRHGTLLTRSGDRLVPSFALALYAQAEGISVDSLLEAARREGRLRLPGLPERYGRLEPELVAPEPSRTVFAHTFPLHFLGPPSRAGEVEREGGEKKTTFPAYTASYVPYVAPSAPEWFRDKVVLVGTGFHDSDRFRTPFYDFRMADGRLAGWMYGVEIHANTLANLLRGEYIRPLPEGLVALLLLVLALGAAGGVFLWGAGGGAAVTAALLGGTVVLASQAFEASLIWVPVVTPTLAAAVAYVASTAYVSIVEGREKRFIRGAFGKYVPPAVVDEIADDPASLRLGGQKRELTLLFSDLAGFTALSEGMDPEVLVSLLNEYLTEMTEIVLAEGGTLDKYIGDAVMAFWNAPRAQADHATRALRCAVRMQRRLGELNRGWVAGGRTPEPLRVRIGINTGTVVVGNVGAEDRFDYSAIGDAVNLASRLEPANKTYGTGTMASEYTVAAARADLFLLRELDLIAVKGKRRPVRVFEVLGLRNEPLAQELAEFLEHYRRGLEAFRSRDWELAERYFAAALELRPDDGPSRLYRERCREFMAEPPPADWDFVVRRTVK